MEKEFTSLRELIERQLLKTEHPVVLHLMQALEHVKKDGFFTKSEFLRMCMWKSPRPQRHFMANSEDLIISISQQVFVTTCEAARIDLLTNLRGVGIPVASAILTLTNPRTYGVLDTRVWQLLYLYKTVSVKPLGTNFSTEDWLKYIEELRRWANEFNVSARAIERTLYEYHKKLQTGTLYKSKASVTPTLF